jgi:hypothetical protein
VDHETSLAEAGEWLTFYPDTVRVAFTVREVQGRRTFKSIPIAIRGAAAEVRLEPPQIALTVRGPERILLDLDRDGAAAVAYVDAARLDPGEHRLPVQLVVPDEVSIDTVEPDHVRVVVLPPAGGAKPTASKDRAPR